MPRAQMMFGNEQKMLMAPCPATGMGLNHGGVFDQLIFQTGRKSNHRTSQSSKTYSMDIPVQEASGLSGLDVYQKYAAGLYGNTEDYPLFFADPMNYDQNLFPEVWASPGLIEQGYNDINESKAQTYYNNILNPDPFTYNSAAGYAGIAGTTGVITTSTSVSSGFSVTWTTATTAISGGMQYSGTVTFPGTVVSVGWTVSSLSTQRVQMFIDWKNAANGLISSTAGTQTVLTGAAAPVELTILNATAPALAVTYDVRVIAVAGTSGVNWAIGNRLTGGFLRSSDAATLPPVSFDGDTPGAMWTGVRGASVSSYFVARIAPTFSDTATNIYNLPYRKTTFTIESQANALPTINNLYGEIPYCIIPIPVGYKLVMGATGSATGTGVIRYVAYNSGLVPSQQATGVLTLLSETASTRLNTTITNAEYVKIYLQRTSAVASTITISSMMAQLWPSAATVTLTGNFIEGKGHRGLNFDDNANSESYVMVDPYRGPIHYKGLSTSLTEVQK